MSSSFRNVRLPPIRNTSLFRKRQESIQPVELSNNYILIEFGHIESFSVWSSKEVRSYRISRNRKLGSDMPVLNSEVIVGAFRDDEHVILAEICVRCADTSSGPGMTTPTTRKPYVEVLYPCQQFIMS